MIRDKSICQNKWKTDMTFFYKYTSDPVSDNNNNSYQILILCFLYFCHILKTVTEI